jgi:protein AroM
MSKVFGAVTIGQSPRPDILDDILAVLGPGTRAVERGALDGLSRAQIDRLAPQPGAPICGENVLVTRLADGSEVTVAERHLVPLVEEKANALFDEGIGAVVLLCTGQFPGFPVKGVLLRAQDLIDEAAAENGRGKRVGVLCPTPQHIPQMRRRWAGVLGVEPQVVCASPYHGAGGVEQAARVLKDAGVQVVVMDCMAYNLETRARVREITAAQVLLPRALAAEGIKKLI